MRELKDAMKFGKSVNGGSGIKCNLCRAVLKVISKKAGGTNNLTSTESEEDKERPGPSTDASPEVDLTEDLALSDSEDEEESAIVL